MKTKQQHSNTCYGIGCLVVFLLFLSSLVVRGQSRSVAKPVGTERRIALVVGNADYLGTANDLRNPLNDANDMEAALKKLGFEVIKVLNTDRVGMSRAINTFRDRLSSADVAFFYYAGHGVSFANKNYLLPTDYDADCLEQIEDYGIALSRVLGDIAAKNVKNSFVVLDACRNLPDLRICDATKRDLGSNTALVKPTNNPRGSAVVYATEEGTKAEDRSPNGRNGLFTGALLKYLTTPDLSLRNILDQASLEVERLSDGSQTPARYEKIYGDFYFLKTQGYTPPPPSRDLPPFVDMVKVQGGSFKRGDYDITVSSFMMGKYEVTVGQYLTFCQETNSHWPEWKEKDSKFNATTGTDDYYKKLGDALANSNHPIVGVSWDDAVAFCKWLSRKEGKVYRLPTEAEWEYAAGGGSSNRTTWADTDDESKLSDYGNISGKDSYKYTSPVGVFAANGLGLHDMSGNVWEWCSDWYGDYPKSSQTNPTGSATGTYRVLRGGSWDYTPYFARVAYRINIGPEYRSLNSGFRLVSQLQ